MNKKIRLRENIDALTNLLTKNPDTKIRYTGFGGIPEILSDPRKNRADNGGLTPEITELYNLCEELDTAQNLHKGSYINSIKNSVLTAFYTPPELITSIYEALRQRDFKPFSFLDPCAGGGAFYDALPADWKKGLLVREIEKDIATAEILRLNRLKEESNKILSIPFEKFNEPLKFSLIASNVPFCDIRIYDENVGNGAEQIHNYFALKSIQHLESLGIVAFLISTGLMDSKGNRHVREALLKESRLLGAWRLPNNTFDTTEACCDLLILQKDELRPDLSFAEEIFCNKTATLEYAGKSVEYNAYYHEYPNRMLGLPYIKGLYGNNFDLGFNNKNGSLIEQLSAALAELPSFPIITREPVLTSIIEPAPVVLSIKESKKSSKHTSDNSLQLDLFSLQSVNSEVPQANNITPTQDDIVSEQSIPPFIEVNLGSYQVADIDAFCFRAMQDGALWAVDDIVGYIKKETINGELVIKIATQTYIEKNTLEQLIHYARLKETFHLLLDAQRIEANNINDLRTLLNEQYDSYYKKYRSINESYTLNKYDSIGLACMLSLENYSKEKRRYEKAQVFNENTYSRDFAEREAVLRSRGARVEDSYFFCLEEKMIIDMNYIAGLAGKSKQSCINELRDFIFYDIQQGRWMPKDEFLSGDVVSKLEALSKYGEQRQAQMEEKQKEEFLRTYTALKSVQPVSIPFDEIDINLGQRWVPLEIYKDFAATLLRTPTNIHYIKSTEEYIVARVCSLGNKLYADAYYLSELLQFTMNGELRKVTRIDPENPKRTIIDAAATRIVQAAQRELQTSFERYLSSRDSAFKKEIENIYNRRFNRIVLREYNAEHVNFDDIQHFIPNKHQRDSTYMAMSNKGGYIAHAVGAGKSLSMGMIMYEMRKKQLIHKPAMLCLNSNIKEICKEIQKAYPSAKILSADAKNFYTGLLIMNGMPFL